MERVFFDHTIKVIDHCEPTEPLLFGKEKLFNEITKNGWNTKKISFWTETDDKYFLIIGKTSDRLIQMLLDEKGIKDYNKPETAIYQWCEIGCRSALVISGADDRGLMYGLIELAARVKASGVEILANTENLLESPDNKIRSVSRFVLSHRDDEWFYSEDFWKYYFERLAGYRYNRFVLILGFDTAYLSPPYPFFIEVPGYKNVKAIGLDDDGRERNLKQLRKIGQLCKNYGMEFNLATWQQAPWTANQSILVEGLEKDEEKLGDYCAAGLKELLIKCEEIDVLQLRVNHEAGVGTQKTNEGFWGKLICAVASVDRKIKLDLRAKGLTDPMIQFALEQGLDIEVPTKHWCEHIALPYHLSQMREEELTRLDNFNHSRRYSYADLLRKPHWYDMIYRLWNYGSNTIFLWGDPDYVKRFSYSLKYGNAVGFEITAPLSLKGGQASIQGESWPLFDDPDLNNYKWEDERYWAWYLFFGRIGYSSKTSEDVWSREFTSRFGKESAQQLESAYKYASKVLPLITAFHMPVHPSLDYWTELSTGAALFGENNYNTGFKTITYQDAEPSDPGLFYKICDYVEDTLKGALKGKYTPLQVKDWLQTFALGIREALINAEKNNLMDGNYEYKTTKIDLLMLADLAEYHTKKIMAAVKLSFFEKINDIAYLLDAHKFMVEAKVCWESLCVRGSVYHSNLQFSAGSGSGIARSGHWKDRLPELEKDVNRLKAILDGLKSKPDEVKVHDYSNTVDSSISACVTDNVPEEITEGKDLTITVKVSDLNLADHIEMYYRHMNQLEGKFNVMLMEKTDDGYKGVIPGEYINYQWDIMVYFSFVNRLGETVIFPGLYHPKYLAPYHVIKVLKK